MRVLIDTCIVIDAMQARKPFDKAAQNIFLNAANNRFVGCITAKSLTDIYYLMHRYTHDDKASRAALGKLVSLFTLLDTAGMDCRHAIPSPVSDFEDAVMIETAIREEADCIVTRNTRDYSASSIPVYTPDAFLDMLATPELYDS